MQSLKHLCVPRASVFDAAKRDTVLNLAALTTGKIDGSAFLEENYVTDGMRVLLTEAFRRLTGKTDQAVFKLTQAMGGGKTHNLLTLGLLAQQPALRAQVLPDLPSPAELPAVRVIAFSGRETDVPHGIWGELARQLGKQEAFASYYSPLKAPGKTAWVNLLKGEPTLILLDELPPYLDNAKAISVGNSDLAKVTATALTNLFEAVAEQEVGKVCIVLTDLVGTYAEATAQIKVVLDQLQYEAQRHAMNLTPVQINTDEFYHIIRKRLFKSLPNEAEIAEVAQGYAEAIRKAKLMDITSQSPEQFGAQVQASYPFHPAIKDLYARFRENPGFQQTRALIRLMRVIAARLWDSGEAAHKYLIAVQDLDLHDPEVLSEIRQINASLENAISHDIAAQGGQSVAEIMDKNLGSTDASDVCRLLFVASLANVPNAVIGLSIAELSTYLAAPKRDLSRLREEVLAKLATAAWYLHSNRDGKLFFRNVENLNAKVESLSRSYLREQCLKEVRQRLAGLFKPIQDWCYQDVLVLPSIDEIKLTAECVTVVISEPHAPGLNPQLRDFFRQATFKNRVAFLTGARDTFSSVVECAGRLRAIQSILEEQAHNHIPPTDPQAQQADELRDRFLNQFLSAVKETFTTLYYPAVEGEQEVLKAAEFIMRFEGNKYSGEEQIRALLREKQKYTEEVDNDTFCKKIVARLFTTECMLWSEVKKRAAINPKWQWHKRDALDAMKDAQVHKEVWREQPGGYVDRSPPPPKTTAVEILPRTRNDDTGLVELKIIPVHGDTIYVEIGAEATTASQRVENGIYATADMHLSFLAVDSTGQSPTGPAREWHNTVTLKHKVFGGAQKKLELQAAPNPDGKTLIRYTTDGSDPKTNGGTYDGAAVALPKGTPVVLAYAERAGVASAVATIAIPGDKAGPDKPIDPNRPATFKRSYKYDLTMETYAFVERLAKHHAVAADIRVNITGDQWLELAMGPKVRLTDAQLTATIEALRQLVSGGQVGIEAGLLHFELGQHLIDWLNDTKSEAKPGEVTQ